MPRHGTRTDRQTHAHTHTHRAAILKANEWMTRYTKVLEKSQYEEAADALVRARTHYVEANEQAYTHTRTRARAHT